MLWGFGKVRAGSANPIHHGGTETRRRNNPEIDYLRDSVVKGLASFMAH